MPLCTAQLCKDAVPPSHAGFAWPRTHSVVHQSWCFAAPLGFAAEILSSIRVACRLADAEPGRPAARAAPATTCWACRRCSLRRTSAARWRAWRCGRRCTRRSAAPAARRCSLASSQTCCWAVRATSVPGVPHGLCSAHTRLFCRSHEGCCSGADGHTAGPCSGAAGLAPYTACQARQAGPPAQAGPPPYGGRPPPVARRPGGQGGRVHRGCRDFRRGRGRRGGAGLGDGAAARRRCAAARVPAAAGRGRRGGGRPAAERPRVSRTPAGFHVMLRCGVLCGLPQAELGMWIPGGQAVLKRSRSGSRRLDVPYCLLCTAVWTRGRPLTLW